MQGDKHSALAACYVSNQEVMESAPSTINDYLNKSDGSAAEQDVNGLEGKMRTPEEIVESTINQNLPDNTNLSASLVLEPVSTSCSPVSGHKTESCEKDAIQHENLNCAVDQPFVSCSPLSGHKTEYREKDAKQHEVDQPITSGIESIENSNIIEKDGDPPHLPLSVTASINESQDQSSNVNAGMVIYNSAPVASVYDDDMPQVIAGNDDIATDEMVKDPILDVSLSSILNEGSAAVSARQAEEGSDSSFQKVVLEHEIKDYFLSQGSASVSSGCENMDAVNDLATDGSNHLFPVGDNSILSKKSGNHAQTAAAAELFEERSDSQSGQIVTEEQEKKECLQSPGQVSVSSAKGNVTSVNNLASDNVCHMGATNDPEKEAGLLDENMVSKPGFAAGKSLCSISSTLKPLEQVDKKLSSNFSGVEPVEENPEQQKGKGSSAEEYVIPNLEVTVVERNSGKVDADIESRETKMKEILGLIPGSVDNRSLEDTTSSCSAFKSETSLGECKNSPDRRFDSEAVGKSSSPKETFISNRDNLETETISSVEVINSGAELQQNDVKEASSLQTLDTQIQLSEGREGKFETESSEKTADVLEHKIVEMVSRVEVLPTAEIHETTDDASRGTNQNKEETFASDMEVDLAENNENAGGSITGTTENKAEEMLTVMEVDLTVVQTTNLEDRQPEASQVEIDARDDQEDVENGILTAPIPASGSDCQHPFDRETEVGENGNGSEPLPKFCESRSMPDGMETSPDSDKNATEAVSKCCPSEYVTPTGVEECENQPNKETGIADRNACDLGKASITDPGFCDSGSTSSSKDIVAGSEVSVENEAPQRDTAEEASFSTPLVSENPFEEASGPKEASVLASPEFYESVNKSTGLEVVGGSELPAVEEASLRSFPVEDLVSSMPVRESEKNSDKEAEEERNDGKPDEASVPACQEHENQSENKTETGGEKLSCPNEASVPEPEGLASGSKCAGMESTAGLEQCVEVETSTPQKLSSEVEIEKSENKSREDGITAEEVPANEDEEVDKAANELQHAAAGAQVGGTSEEEAVIQQIGGDDSKDAATDLVVNPTASETGDTNDDLGGEKSEVATDSEANAAVSGATDVMEGDSLKAGPDSEIAPPQSQEMKKDDDLPSSPPDHSPKASASASPPDMKTE